MNEDRLLKPTRTATLALRIITYAALLLLVLIVGFFPIVTTAKISLKMIHASAPDH
ncbi:MAG: hypothetical protein H6Q05_1997 [Acidobacteria bacterium]|nr:hypothetical protein [Acidobacteriota bacterium]